MSLEGMILRPETHGGMADSGGQRYSAKVTAPQAWPTGEAMLGGAVASSAMITMHMALDLAYLVSSLS